MPWQLSLAVRGDLRKFLAADRKAGASAVTNVIRRRTLALQRQIRGAIRSAGLGERLGNTVRATVYPQRGQSLGAKGVISSKAIYKRPGGLVDLLTVFQEGATITARGGTFLVIPVGAGKKESLSNFRDADIELVPFRNGQGYVVLRRGARGFGRGGGGILFILVKKATIKRRLDLTALAEAAQSGIDQDIADEWEKQASRLGVLE